MSTTQTVLAIYENGMLRPLQPLALTERTQVSVTITSGVEDTSADFDGVLGAAASSDQPAPTLEAVRKITAKIPVSLSQLVREERERGR